MAEQNVESKYDNMDAPISFGNEILTLCIGQCGIFAGNEYYSTIMNEHKLDKQCVFTGDVHDTNDRQLLSKIDTHFSNTPKSNQYTPRAVFIDIDNTSLNKIRCSPLGSQLPSHHLMDGGYSEPSVIYPKGYNDGMDIIDAVMENIRKEIESCDSFQGVNMIHALGGGSGSGFASLLLNRLSDDYPRKYRFTHTIWPCIAAGYRSFLFSQHLPLYETYNTVLAVNQLMDHSELNLIVNNANLLNAAVSKLKLKPANYDDMNWIFSLIMSGTTAPFRFVSEPDLCSNMKKMEVYFRLFPRLHFLNLCHSPFIRKTEWKYNDHNISIVDGCFVNDVSRVKMEDGKMFHTATFYRSNDKQCINDMNKFMERIGMKIADDFVSWIPHNVTSSFIHDGGFQCYSDKTTMMSTTIMHNTAIKSVFQRASAMFARHYKRRSHTHFYLSEGMEHEEFREADMNVRNLVTELQDKQDAYIEY